MSCWAGPSGSSLYKISIGNKEKAITVDEALRRQKIDADDDGSQEFLGENGVESYDEDYEDEEF